MDNYTELDLKTWERTQHFQVFSMSQNPFYTVQFDVDVTDFYRYVKEHKLSFTLAMVYVTTAVANKIENYRYRFVDKKPVLFDKIDTSFMYLNKQTKLFKVVNCDFEGTLEEFVAVAKEKADNQTEYFAAAPPNNSFTFTCLPWVQYTTKTHSYSGNNFRGGAVFDWGKIYTDTNQRLKMPFSVESNHCFVDGYHVGVLNAKLQAELDSFANK